MTTKVFYADTKADLTKVTGAEMGSVCYVIDEAAKYMMNSKGEWICQSGISQADLAEYIKKDFVEANYRPIKYSIAGTPEGTIVDYTRSKEIRIFCPETVEFKKHESVGEGANPNIFYAVLNVYAPEGAVSLKEGDQGAITTEMIELTHTDKFGRKYKPMWIALAMYNESNDSWIYYGANSKANDMIGWTYMIEWYNAEGKMIDADVLRINLSNKDCHFSLPDCFI